MCRSVGTRNRCGSTGHVAGRDGVAGGPRGEEEHGRVQLPHDGKDAAPQVDEVARARSRWERRKDGRGGRVTMVADLVGPEVHDNGATVERADEVGVRATLAVGVGSRARMWRIMRAEGQSAVGIKGPYAESAVAIVCDPDSVVGGADVAGAVTARADGRAVGHEPRPGIADVEGANRSCRKLAHGVEPAATRVQSKEGRCGRLRRNLRRGDRTRIDIQQYPPNAFAGTGHAARGIGTNPQSALGSRR